MDKKRDCSELAGVIVIGFGLEEKIKSAAIVRRFSAVDRNSLTIAASLKVNRIMYKNKLYFAVYGYTSRSKPLSQKASMAKLVFVLSVYGANRHS
ncbi:hypothetical protein AM10699_24480 [Acaryochloris marina MBIC10699]|nr:hypothetical protein AM10699_24480 [Acaryochloris marina MBIC10699]